MNRQRPRLRAPRRESESLLFGQTRKHNGARVTDKWISEKWHVSYLNFAEDVRKGMCLPERVLIADCTLRDGEQQAGIVFNKEDKLEIARKLDDIGVDQIEAGMPAVSKEDAEALRLIIKEGLKAKVYALARAMKQDIDLVVDCGCDGVQISLPIGYLQMQRHKWSEEGVINSALEMIDYAKAHGLWVNLSPYDTTRAKSDFLTRYLAATTRNAQVDRVRLVDTVGSATPAAVHYLVKEMRRTIKDIPIEVHCHNDFGLATANTLAGVEAGAEVVSTTLNGYGERVGNASMWEVALALKLLYGYDLHLKFDKFYEVSKFVEQRSGVKLGTNQPVVGEGAFKAESGLTVAGIIEDPFTGMAYLPQLVGQTLKVVLGKKSGRKNIQSRLEELGITASLEQVDAILERVKTESLRKRSEITREEFKVIVSSVLGT